MHIILTVNVAWNIWNFRKSLVQALLDDGHRLTILAPPDETVAELEEMGCAFEPLVMNRKGLNPVDDFILAVRMRSAFKRLRPDIVLSFTIKNNLFGGLASKRMPHVFIPNVTGLGTAFLAGRGVQRVAEALYKVAFNKIPVVFFQNEDDQKLFESRSLVSAGQAHILPGSGIDLARFAYADYPASDDETCFLMVARLLRDKGIVEYAEAAARVRRSHPDARFLLLGALDFHNRTSITQDMLDGWVRAGTIEYLGTTKDVRPALALAHCVVLPSYREGAPRTLIEAAAVGRPTIATDVPGCRAVVDDGLTGYLCEAKSSDSLAQAMLRFLALPQSDRALLGVRARKKIVAEYSDQIIISKYREQINAASRRRPIDIGSQNGRLPE